MIKNPREVAWLKEMMVRKELGYLPEDADEMSFISAIISETNNISDQEINKNNDNNRLKGLIQKNR